MKTLATLLLVVLAACSGSSSGGGSGSDGGGGGGADGAPVADASPGSGSVCTDPIFVTSDPNGGMTMGDYYVHNNMWNCTDYPCEETLSACSAASWFVVGNMNDAAHDGAVKTYPNVHKDYADVSIDTFAGITSTYAAVSPHVGIYDVAYDIWLNGVAADGSTEIMIWTDNYNQVPGGDLVDTVTSGGHSFDVYKTADSGYIAFVPAAPIPSGTVDLLDLFDYVVGQGWMPSGSTLGQVDFGVEIVSTDDTDARFDFTDFSITES